MAQPGLKWMVRRSNDGPSGMHSSLINLYSEVLPKIWANNKEFIKGRVRYGSYHVTATVGGRLFGPKSSQTKKILGLP